MKNLLPNIRPFCGMSGFGQRSPKHKQNIVLDIFHSLTEKENRWVSLSTIVQQMVVNLQLSLE
jgi:hypothetical protein